jgi:hypothetical protein
VKESKAAQKVALVEFELLIPFQLSMRRVEDSGALISMRQRISETGQFKPASHPIAVI